MVGFHFTAYLVRFSYLWINQMLYSLTFICHCIYRWLKVVPMVTNMMESSSPNLYGSNEVMFLILQCSYNVQVLSQSLLLSFLQNLIDLAGSESSKTETTGLRRKEGSYINKSLLTLGTVGASKFNMSLKLKKIILIIFYLLPLWIIKLRLYRCQ